MVRVKRAKPGQVLQLKQCEFGYQLPADLEPGTLATVVGFRPGRVIVRVGDQERNLAIQNIDSGHEYQLGGRWYDEKHPITQAWLRGRKKDEDRGSH
jgi:hypothetical protein